MRKITWLPCFTSTPLPADHEAGNECPHLLGERRGKDLATGKLHLSQQPSGSRRGRCRFVAASRGRTTSRGGWAAHRRGRSTLSQEAAVSNLLSAPSSWARVRSQVSPPSAGADVQLRTRTSQDRVRDRVCVRVCGDR